MQSSLIVALNLAESSEGKKQQAALTAIMALVMFASNPAFINNRRITVHAWPFVDDSQVFFTKRFYSHLFYLMLNSLQKMKADYESQNRLNKGLMGFLENTGWRTGLSAHFSDG